MPSWPHRDRAEVVKAQSRMATYERTTDRAWAEYRAVERPAWEKYQRAEAKARAKRDK